MDSFLSRTMDITRDQQIALDDALVAPANRLKIGKSNLRLSSDLKSKEATLQVVYDVLKLTPFYKAFQITTDVPEIHMQEFWATTTVHHHSIHFKMNNKKHIVNLEYFREMLQICLKLPNQQFEELPFEDAILTFLRDLGHSGEIKVITNVNVNNLRLSQAQILWGMYHKKNVDYVYLLWEDFVYQVESKNAKRSNEMYYPRFTKVIVNFFVTKDQSIPRRNSVNWHFARDDYMFTTIKVVSRHEDTQLYGVILPNELTNDAIKDSESYKEYYAIASGAEPPKTKASVKKKQVGSDNGSGADEGTDSKPGVPDVPTYGSDDEQISWKSNDEEDDDEVGMNDDDDDNDGDDDNDDDEDNDDDNDNADNQDDDDQEDDGQNNEDQDDVNEHTNSDNDGDDFIHPKLSTQDQEVRHNEEESDEEIQGANVEEEELDEEETNDEDEANELYKDMNVNLEGRDIEMRDAQQTNV
ncbi:hypothetical protein Tco_0257767 [Tanacetum coccineum]